MNGTYSWKRTEDIDIDLADMLRRLGRQWKRIAACALASALLLGGYGCLKAGRNQNLAESAVAEDADLTQAEKQAVEDAVCLEKEIRGLETYMDGSVLMQIDAYQKNRVIMLFCIDQAKRQELLAVTESYLNFILNGGAADMLGKSSIWKMEKPYMAELISAYQRTYSSPYQVTVSAESEDSVTAESLFYVEITGKDAGTAEKMALEMQDVLETYSADAGAAAGRHRLSLVSMVQNVTADSGLMTLQHDKKALLSSNRTSLRGMTDAFSREQMAAYREAGAQDEDRENEWEEMEAVSGTAVKTGIQYLFLGLVAGVFAYAGIFSCWYVFSDTIKSAEEMKRLYAIPLYGTIRLGTGKKNRSSGTGPNDSGKEQIVNRIRMACTKQGIRKLYAVSDYSFDMQEKECLLDMSQQLKSWEIDMEAAENACMDKNAWDELAAAGTVFLVCRTGVTTHRMIDDAMNFYQENGITVAGAAVFTQNW